MAVVIFGRPYNAFADEAHMGIPRKLASRGHRVLPLDCLPLDGQHAKRHMYWGYGQRILQAARLVAAHPQLFGVYITNFSCGPDSFVISYFRDIMGSKPSLTLELDSHTADAGLETRIEAFLDVVAAWRHLRPTRPSPVAGNGFRPARTTVQQGVPGVTLSTGNWLPMTDPRVTLLFPSMGRLSSEALAAAFSAAGVHSIAARPADDAILKLGRTATTGKECLPLILTTGTLLHHRHQCRSDEVLLYFMATGSGPCRFGQYKVFMEDLIRKRALDNVALFSLDSENGYSGLGRRLHGKSWQSLVVADAMEDIRAMLLANAKDPQGAMVAFDRVWRELTWAMASHRAGAVDRQLERSAATLGEIALKQAVEAVPVVALVGEIFVRRDSLSRQFITERLAHMGFATCCTPVSEWLHYADWLLARKLAVNGHKHLWRKLALMLKQRSVHRSEARIRQTLARSGLIGARRVVIPDIIDHARPYLAPDHHGEAILTIGSALSEVALRACGVIAIGPFGCMPNRIAESILSAVMTTADKLRCPGAGQRLHETLKGMDALPFLAIESDGSPFPQVIEANLEAFCLRARHLHRRMQATRRCLHN
jgi:predicted nucleotide-binding protein (sugar kinase/HSP70/actin superfamily)